MYLRKTGKFAPHVVPFSQERGGSASARLCLSASVLLHAPCSDGGYCEFARDALRNRRLTLIIIGWILAVTFIVLYATAANNSDTSVAPADPNVKAFGILAINDVYELNPIGHRGGTSGLLRRPGSRSVGCAGLRGLPSDSLFSLPRLAPPRQASRVSPTCATA